jgi:hypothetical protein
MRYGLCSFIILGMGSGKEMSDDSTCEAKDVLGEQLRQGATCTIVVESRIRMSCRNCFSGPLANHQGTNLYPIPCIVRK